MHRRGIRGLRGPCVSEPQSSIFSMGMCWVLASGSKHLYRLIKGFRTTGNSKSCGLSMSFSGKGVPQEHEPMPF